MKWVVEPGGKLGGVDSRDREFDVLSAGAPDYCSEGVGAVFRTLDLELYLPNKTPLLLRLHFLCSGIGVRARVPSLHLCVTADTIFRCFDFIL